MAFCSIGCLLVLVAHYPLTVPSVELYSPGLFEGDSDWTEPVPVLCLVRDTSPGRHRVLWTIGAEAASPGSAEEGEIEPDGSYSVRSCVTISANQWNSGAVKCEVYNNITNVTEKVSASLRRQDPHKTRGVRLQQRLSEHLESRARFVCFKTGGDVIVIKREANSTIPTR
ncbi:UNVERIFIED_CONTAM: hypothetical protein FKN15_055174 [Acipenser sinensis]